MTTTKRQSHKNLRPKHKQTKKYLKHYYPFIPLFASIGFLLIVLLSPLYQNRQSVLAVSSSISTSTLLDATNKVREAEGSRTLTLNDELNYAAQKKAQDMTTRNYWSHKTPEGNDPWAFINETSYRFNKAGENLAYGFENSDGVVTGWMNSPSHRSNMLDKSFSEVGFGVADSTNFNNSGPSTVVVALYGQPQELNTAVSNDMQIHILGEGMTIRTANIFTGSHWSIYLIGAVIGACFMYLVIVHGNRIRKVVKKGEKFFIRNPLLDSAVILLIAVGILLLRTVGIVL